MKYEIPNNDMQLGNCKRCKGAVLLIQPHYRNNGELYCWQCAFIEKKISEKKFLQCAGVYLKNTHAAVYDSKIVIWTGSKNPPWKRTDKQERQSTKYKKWRTKVFQRDRYTCQICGQVGGELNAHHILSFKKYKALRYKLENGITLCRKCHKKIHSKRGGNK